MCGRGALLSLIFMFSKCGSVIHYFQDLDFIEIETGMSDFVYVFQKFSLLRVVAYLTMHPRNLESIVSPLRGKKRIKGIVLFCSFSLK